MRLTPSLVFLVLANLLPVAGVIWWEWSVLSVMLLFWLENIIVGVLNIPRILFASGDGDARARGFVGRFLISIFFSVHYGMFTFGHGVFVFSLFGVGIETDPTPQLVIWMIDKHQLLWPVLALFASHFISLIMNYFVAGEYKTARVNAMMRQPYSRIIVLHLGIIFGGFILQTLQQPFMGLIILIALKIIFDVRAHRKEHRALSATIPADAEAV